MSEQSKPEPAVGQVWQWRSYPAVALLRIEAGIAQCESAFRVGMDTLRRDGRCVGVDTPAGRVMVDERRHNADGGPSCVHEVTHVMRGTIVRTDCGGFFGEWQAAKVATWPIVPALAAGVERLGIPLAPDSKWTLIALTEDPRAHLPVPDPAATKRARRREIDAILRDDARRFPAFATARKSATLCAMEADASWPVSWVSDLSALLRDYENLRGGMREPRADAKRMAGKYIHPDTVAAYERARSLP